MENVECKVQNGRPLRYTNLQIRTKQFALEVIAFCEQLPNDETSNILKRQLLRAGTSVGANYRAACRAKSKPTFISKMGDVLEEADECGYWMELLTESGRANPTAVESLLKEASELVAISISSINTAKQSSGKEGEVD